MAIRIVTAATVKSLELLVNQTEIHGWKASGAPFRDDGLDLWCWVMTRGVVAPENGDVRLREPERKGRR